MNYTRQVPGVLWAGVAAFVLFTAVSAPAAEYVSEVVCRMCHYTIAQKWKKTGHAGAFDKLLPEERRKAQCQPCHATARNVEGVQCEACHGAGGDYFPMAVMKDPDQAAGAGLKQPTRETCLRCHAGRAPHNLKAFRYDDVDFLKLVHGPGPKAGKSDK